MKSKYEFTDKLIAMRLALYRINGDLINLITDKTENTLRDEAINISKVIKNDGKKLDDTNWVIDALTQQCFDLTTIKAENVIKKAKGVLR